VSGQHHAPAELYPQGKSSQYPLYKRPGRPGPRAGLDAQTTRKILCLCWGSNPGHPVHSQTLYHLKDTGYCSVAIILTFIIMVELNSDDYGKAIYFQLHLKYIWELNFEKC
jgi:hypothetical protein